MRLAALFLEVLSVDKSPRRIFRSFLMNLWVCFYTENNSIVDSFMSKDSKSTSSVDLDKLNSSPLSRWLPVPTNAKATQAIAATPKIPSVNARIFFLPVEEVVGIYASGTNWWNCIFMWLGVLFNELINYLLCLLLFLNLRARDSTGFQWFFFPPL